MTPLAKAVARRTTGKHRGREMVVTLYPGDLIALRHVRSRTEYTIPLSWVYDLAVKAEVARKKAEKSAAKKLAKGKR